METIYDKTLRMVASGARFNIDLQKRNLKVNGKYVIKQGEYEGELGIDPTSTPDALKQIECLFDRYKHSVPSARSDAKRKTYFRALPEHELSEDDMLFGERRDIAQVALELNILGFILNGSLQWELFADNKWFWESSEKPGLVILKKWITNK